MNKRYDTVTNDIEQAFEATIKDVCEKVNESQEEVLPNMSDQAFAEWMISIFPPEQELVAFDKRN